MYDKPTEKNKTKLTGFQLAGAVLAALLLVVGGALTLYRSGDEHKINVGMQQPSIDSSESLDSTELTADLEQAQNALKQVVKDKEITAVGTYAGWELLQVQAMTERDIFLSIRYMLRNTPLKRAD